MPADAEPGPVAALKPKRRWHQFSIVSLLGLVLAVAIGLALVVNPAARQRRAVAFVDRLGGSVGYANGIGRHAPGWLRALGDEYLVTVE